MRRLFARWAETLESLADGVRSRRPALAITALALEALVLAWIWAIDHRWIDALTSATGGLVEFTLPVSLVAFAVVIVGGLRLWGGVSFGALGLRREGLATAALACLVVWVAFHLGTLLLIVVQGASWSIGVADHTARTAIAALIAQLLGNALFEETLYRGYLLPRFMDRLGSLPLAIAGSQAVFALAHVPHRLVHGFGAAELAGSLAIVWGLGVAMSILYVWTRNLWLVVGVHALLNAPTVLLDPRW